MKFIHLYRKSTTLSSPNGSYGYIGSPNDWNAIDPGSDFTYNPGGIVIPDSGVYQIDWTLILNSAGKGLVGISINNSSPNGGNLRALGTVNNLAAAAGNGSEVLTLGAGDILGLYAYGDGGAMSIQTASSVHWGITQLALI